MIDLKARKKGIGGSDIGVIIGENRYKTPLELYLDKLDLMPDRIEKSYQGWGKKLEGVIADAFAEATGYRVFPDATLFIGDEEWHIGNIDRFYIDDDGERCVLECKSANAFTVKDWEDGPYTEYICQIQWYLYLTKCKKGTIAVLIGGSDFRTYPIEADYELIELLKKATDHFWLEHVMKQIPPENSNTSPELMELLYPKSNGTEIALNDDHIGFALKEYIRIREEIKERDEALKANKAVIEAAMMEAGKAIWTNGNEAIAVSWGNTTKKSFDSKLLEKEHPEIYAQYLKDTTYRVLRVTEKNLTKKIKGGNNE